MAFCVRSGSEARVRIRQCGADDDRKPVHYVHVARTAPRAADRLRKEEEEQLERMRREFLERTAEDSRKLADNFGRMGRRRFHKVA